MQGTHWWLVCYDVRDPKRLRKAAKHMEGYGERMQYSVFRCWLNPRGMEQLRWELTEMLTPEDDVLVIPLCSSCVEGCARRTLQPKDRAGRRSRRGIGSSEKLNHGWQAVERLAWRKWLEVSCRCQVAAL